MIPFNPFAQAHGRFEGRELNSDPFFSPVRAFQLKQIHSSRLFWLESSQQVGQSWQWEGDALLCTLPEIPIAIRTADCTPILLAHPDGLVGAVHAGWRGTQKKILSKVLNEIQERGFPLCSLEIAIGPAICGDCYEVGEEVAQEFDAEFLKQEEKSIFLDLKKANVHQAFQAGVKEDQIQVHAECTLCHEDRFYSYRGDLKRGDRKEGRNYAWIVLRK